MTVDHHVVGLYPGSPLNECCQAQGQSKPAGTVAEKISSKVPLSIIPNLNQGFLEIPGLVLEIPDLNILNNCGCLPL